MVSYQQLKSTIDGLKEISKIDFSIFDVDARCVATTLGTEPNIDKKVAKFILSKEENVEIPGYFLCKITEGEQVEYVLAVSDVSEQSRIMARMVAFQLCDLVFILQEKSDKDGFFKNLLLDNLLLVDIHNESQKQGIVNELKRVAVIIEPNNRNENELIDNLKECDLMGDNYITSVDEANVICIKEVKNTEGNDYISKDINKLREVLDGLGYKDCRIASGTVVNSLKDISRSYKEARTALDVGKIFLEDKRIVAYSELGIGRIIYQLPIPLCRMFIREIFGDMNPDDFDRETNESIDKFFDNSLNVSETARQLFIHRNTLVYRLDKIQKMTNLDIRTFDDAITFKIAMMVVKYMKYVENQ